MAQSFDLVEGFSSLSLSAATLQNDFFAAFAGLSVSSEHQPKPAQQQQLDSPSLANTDFIKSVQMNRVTGLPVGHPFNGFFQQPPLPPPSHHQTSSAAPTAYYLEQAAFYLENNSGPDPFANAPEEPQPRPAQAIYDAIFKFFIASATPIFSPLTSIFSATFAFCWSVLANSLVAPVLFLVDVLCTREVLSLVLQLLACSLTMLLIPAWNGEVVVETGDARPVYQLYWATGREAIGNGAVGTRG
ncbi:unnamed protein product [Diplocarpon coronariae]|uniref:Uncharacterized protein n=1 Tax=Diplocarpon coronariae TaxID=2795749 RepID=A0A218YUE1_9HELO|nr:hypothetical protein B2J93_2878 [Marssonina coronariae]